ncbi:uncharacterized protein LOC125039432 isoform X2 [Penaeus chinensis]|nr:uncharacterized protein LOC125039432 isoform X2 [Penaeus chinensis]
MSQPLNCCFCGRGDENEVEFGKIYTIDDVSVHYYCLLFSSGLAQNGEDDEGVLGFLAEDIVKEVQRGRKLSCCYCLRKGATIGCYNKKCRRTYHYPCGVKQSALCKFSNDFRSYCSQHREYQQGLGCGEELECPICMEELMADPKKAIWAPCCKRKTWFHKMCLQRLALSAGYFFKCPLCNDKDVFQLEMQNLGIFVPEKDASWELEPNAFSELLERPIHCDAPKCKCPDGRKTDVEGTRWEVLLCNLCGSTGVHIQCGGLPFVCTEWNCPTCVNMLSESFKRTQQEERQRRLNERKSKISDSEDLPLDSPQGCCSSAASGSVAMDVSENRETLTPGKRKREDVETGMETPPKMRHLEDMESFSKITYASDSDEEIDVESGEYQVPPHTNIRELEELGEELPKELRKLKNYALRAQERMQELRLTEADIVRIAKEAAHKKDIALDKSQVTRFFRYKLPLEKMLPIAELIRKVFAFREAMVLEAQTSSAAKKKGGTSTPSRRGRRRSGTPNIKIPLLKTAISQSLITTGISPIQKEKPVDTEAVNTDLPGSWSMYRACKTIGKLTSGLDTETDPVDSKPDSILEAQSEGKVKEEVPEIKDDVSIKKEDGSHQKSVRSSLAKDKNESETELTLFLSPMSSQGSVGSKLDATETRMNKENEGVNQDVFQSSQACRKLLLNSNNPIAKETAESLLPREGVRTTSGLPGGIPSSERHVWKKSNQLQRKAPGMQTQQKVSISYISPNPRRRLLENQWKPLSEKIEDELKLEEQSNQELDDLDFEELLKSSENCISDFETQNFEKMLSSFCLATPERQAAGGYSAVEEVTYFRRKSQESAVTPVKDKDQKAENRYLRCDFAEVTDRMTEIPEGCDSEIQKLPRVIDESPPIPENPKENSVTVPTSGTNAHGAVDMLQQEQQRAQAKKPSSGSSQQLLRKKRKRGRKKCIWKQGLRKCVWGWYRVVSSPSNEPDEKESELSTVGATSECLECYVALERLPHLDKAKKIQVSKNIVKVWDGKRVTVIFLKSPARCTG